MSSQSPMNLLQILDCYGVFSHRNLLIKWIDKTNRCLACSLSTTQCDGYWCDVFVMVTDVMSLWWLLMWCLCDGYWCDVFVMVTDVMSLWWLLMWCLCDGYWCDVFVMVTDVMSLWWLLMWCLCDGYWWCLCDVFVMVTDVMSLWWLLMWCLCDGYWCDVFVMVTDVMSCVCRSSGAGGPHGDSLLACWPRRSAICSWSSPVPWTTDEACHSWKGVQRRWVYYSRIRSGVVLYFPALMYVSGNVLIWKICSIINIYGIFCYELQTPILWRIYCPLHYFCCKIQAILQCSLPKNYFISDVL